MVSKRMVYYTFGGGNLSAFMIADFKEDRGDVYFEAGYAMGLGMPVIWTCRRQYNHIVWENPEELYQKLKNGLQLQFYKIN